MYIYLYTYVIIPTTQLTHTLEYLTHEMEGWPPPKTRSVGFQVYKISILFIYIDLYRYIYIFTCTRWWKTCRKTCFFKNAPLKFIKMVRIRFPTQRPGSFEHQPTPLRPIQVQTNPKPLEGSSMILRVVNYNHLRSDFFSTPNKKTNPRLFQSHKMHVWVYLPTCHTWISPKTAVVSFCFPWLRNVPSPSLGDSKPTLTVKV